MPPCGPPTGIFTQPAMTVMVIYSHILTGTAHKSDYEGEITHLHANDKFWFSSKFVEFQVRTG